MSYCSHPWCPPSPLPPTRPQIETYVKVVSGSCDSSKPPLTELPIATEDTLGVIKVGDGLIVDENGVLSLDPEEACDCDDDRILDGGDADGEIDYIQYLDGGTAAGV